MKDIVGIKALNTPLKAPEQKPGSGRQGGIEAAAAV